MSESVPIGGFPPIWSTPSGSSKSTKSSDSCKISTSTTGKCRNSEKLISSLNFPQIDSPGVLRSSIPVVGVEINYSITSFNRSYDTLKDTIIECYPRRHQQAILLQDLTECRSELLSNDFKGKKIHRSDLASTIRETAKEFDLLQIRIFEEDISSKDVQADLKEIKEMSIKSRDSFLTDSVSERSSPTSIITDFATSTYAMGVLPAIGSSVKQAGKSLLNGVNILPQ